MGWLEGRIVDLDAKANMLDSVRGELPTRTGTIARTFYNGRWAFDFTAASNKLEYSRKRVDLPPLTVTALVVPIVSGGDGSIAAFGGSFATKGWTLRLLSTGIRMTYSGVADYNASNIFKDLTSWQAVTLAMAPSRFEIWRDGVYKTAVGTGTMVANSQSLVLGTNAGSQEFGGYIGRFIMHNRVLEPGEIVAMHRELLYPGRTQGVSVKSLAASFKAFLYYIRGIRND